jgi:hypothetical protein
MAKKPGPKKGSTQRRKSGPKGGTASYRKEPSRSGSSGEKTKKQSGGSRLAALAKLPLVRNFVAATLVSAAGALLFNKRGGKRYENERQDHSDSSLPSSPAVADTTDPRVAAGVTAKGRRKQSGAASKPRRRAGTAEEGFQPVEPGPGAYPDGSPAGDLAGRASVEGTGNDRIE